ncbi:MAG: hypothetical protein L0G22_11380, partial [Propionibacteriaceae bacterium]|nr:hypothetical protein [Propionibacteriaceae bacterium]
MVRRRRHARPGRRRHLARPRRRRRPHLAGAAPLGLEAEITPAALAAARLDPRRSLEHVARELRHPVLAARVRAVASERGLSPADTPAWYTSRLSVERTFGSWHLVTADGAHTPASALVAVLTDRLAARGV